jgi:hypothetical protein
MSGNVLTGHRLGLHPAAGELEQNIVFLEIGRPFTTRVRLLRRIETIRRMLDRHAGGDAAQTPALAKTYNRMIRTLGEVCASPKVYADNDQVITDGSYSPDGYKLHARRLLAFGSTLILRHSTIRRPALVRGTLATSCTGLQRGNS